MSKAQNNKGDRTRQYSDRHPHAWSTFTTRNVFHRIHAGGTAAVP